MAKRRLESEEDKKPLTKAGLQKFIGVFRFVGPYRWSFFAGLGALTLSSLTILSFPFLGGKLMDVAQGHSWRFLSTVNEVVFLLVAVLVFQSIFSFLRVYFFANVSERALADLRHAVYEKIIWLPQTFFDSRRVGELTSRITSDVSTLQDAFSSMLAELLRQSLMLIIGTIIILVLTPKLTFFMLLTFPVLVLAALFFGKFIRKLSKKTQDQLASANVIVEETFQSIAVVKSFTNEVFEVLRYRKSLNDVVSTALHAARYRGIFISFIILTLFSGIVAVSWFGATLVHDGKLLIGELFSFVLYTGVIGASIAGLGDLYSQLQRAIGASDRILEILDLKDEKSADSASVKLRGEISLQEVSFSYPTRSDVVVLKSISFDVAAGEKIALVGPSGSGKSTIINLLMRFYPIHKGTIKADGKNILDYDLSAYRKNIGVVPQEVILFGGTIRENIAYGKPGASDDEILMAARKANALEFIETFPEKLDTIVGDRGVKLSGGQRQRVAIARAILKDPAILILDEATSALDAKSERLVQDALQKLMENRTTVIIAHRLSTIRKADRIMVIKDGQIAESGTHDRLISMDDGIYSNLLKLQLETEPS
ncbi:MAG: multidrug ABC transporter ATP-binding protein [Azospira oryzae]|jgi:ATP-binding cassette subfamily B protein|nr:MAG: multidrug ABC transporter ATP-binding protein [Azospira oryzae]